MSTTALCRLPSLRAFAALGALTLCLTAINASAASLQVTSTDQVGLPPSGLRWQRMHTVILQPDHPSMVKVDRKDIEATRRIWADEVASAQARGKEASFDSQIASVSYRNVPISFSLISLPQDFERCEAAANGKNVVDVYAKCLARVAIGAARTPHIVEFSGFCYADSIWATPEELRFREKTQNQFAFDANTGTAYFRLIQHGSIVPACNRMIKIEGL